METITKGFGCLIAYVLPGLLALWGIGFLSPDVAAWLQAATQNASMGAFLVVVSIGVGVFLSAIRACSIDRWMPKPPTGNRLPDTEEVYQNLLSQHYMYSHFYGNSIPAAVIFAVGWAIAGKHTGWTLAGAGVFLVAVLSVLIWATHDTLTRLQGKVERLFKHAAASHKEHV